MRLNGRAKGSKAELQVAKLLKDFWDPLEVAEWKRVPLSGGWGGSSEARLGFKTAGDITTTAKRWPFSVEVKHRQNWNMENVLAGKKSPVWGWWEQARTQGAESDMKPLLFFRKNNQDWSLMFSASEKIFPFSWLIPERGVLIAPWWLWAEQDPKLFASS